MTTTPSTATSTPSSVASIIYAPRNDAERAAYAKAIQDAAIDRVVRGERS